MPGPAPTPAALRELEGNPSKRPIPDEPKPEAVSNDIPPPDNLSAYAKEEWARMFPVLRACGLMTMADLTAFAIYCSLFGRWRQTEEDLSKLKDEAGNPTILTKTPNGHAQASALLTISRQTAELMHSYLKEFGMTPAARARLGSHAPTPPPAKQGDGAKAAIQAGKFTGLIGKE